MQEHASELLAAVDLGSNSFHMIVGRLDDGTLTIVDKMRERVRLGAGLDAHKHLTPDARQRALDCLERFGERLKAMRPGQVRVVGTNTLRKMKDSDGFAYEARLALGHPVEIIAGREEARLIYLGVAQTVPSDGRQRLVVDIGGGSTECIVGIDDTLHLANSLYMGCVDYSLKYFRDGALTKAAFETAKLTAQVELQPIIRRYRELGWQVALGCSGTVHAVTKIVGANGWSEPGFITADGLADLTDALVTAETLNNLELDGLQDDRRPVIAGGVAILNAVFDSFQLERMAPSPGALREGALYDLVGRIHHEDVRERTIRKFQRVHEVDEEHAERVGRVAIDLLDQVGPAWGLDGPEPRQLLGWAASLHEVGLSISYTGYHKHSAYVVIHADMAGFSVTTQTILGAIIRTHRRKMRETLFDDLGRERDSTIKLAVLFRLAVALCRSRLDEPPSVVARAKGDHVKLAFSSAWAERHPMSMVNLDEHVDAIRRVGIDVTVVTT